MWCKQLYSTDDVVDARKRCTSPNWLAIPITGLPGTTNHLGIAKNKLDKNNTADYYNFQPIWTKLVWEMYYTHTENHYNSWYNYESTCKDGCIGECYIHEVGHGSSYVGGGDGHGIGLAAKDDNKYITKGHAGKGYSYKPWTLWDDTHPPGILFADEWTVRNKKTGIRFPPMIQLPLFSSNLYDSSDKPVPLKVVAVLQVSPNSKCTEYDILKNSVMVVPSFMARCNNKYQFEVYQVPEYATIIISDHYYTGRAELYLQNYSSTIQNPSYATGLWSYDPSILIGNNTYRFVNKVKTSIGTETGSIIMTIMFTYTPYKVVDTKSYFKYYYSTLCMPNLAWLGDIKAYPNIDFSYLSVWIDN